MALRILKSVLVLLLFCSAGSLTAQDSETEWILIEENSGVKIYRSFGTCEEINSIFMKIENTNAFSVTTTFSKVYNDYLLGSEELLEENISLTVPAMSSVQGDCTMIGLSFYSSSDYPLVAGQTDVLFEFTLN